jgi:hypothetical protein
MPKSSYGPVHKGTIRRKVLLDCLCGISIADFIEKYGRNSQNMFNAILDQSGYDIRTIKINGIRTYKLVGRYKWSGGNYDFLARFGRLVE